MILRHCKACRRDRALSTETCSCGSTAKDGDTFKAMVVVPRSGGKRKARTKPTLEAARQAEQELQDELKPFDLPLPSSPLPSSHPQQQRSGPTLAEIWQTYSPYIELRKRSYKADVQRWRDYLRIPPHSDHSFRCKLSTDSAGL